MARGRKGLGVEALAGSIRLKFTLSSGKRVSETLNWAPTTANMRRAERLALAVRRDIEYGVLTDERYLEHFPATKRIAMVETVGARTFGDFADLFYQSCGKMAQNTRDQYRIQLTFWKKLLGADKPMIEFRHSDIKAKIGGFPWNGWRHHNNYLIPLRGVFAMWWSDDPIHRVNPLTGIKNMKKNGGEGKVDKSDALAEPEERKLLAKIAELFDPQVFNYFDAAFATGLRPEEEIELKWSDLVLTGEKPVARIRRARSAGEVRWPKNGKPRDVELSPRAVAAFRRQQAFTGDREDGYVFLNPVTGKAWNSTASQREVYWNRIVAVLNMRHLTPYSTRHTRASRMLMAGCNPAWCAAQLGQSKEMFFRVYADWIDADDSGTELAKVDGGIRPVFVHAGVARQVAER
jgi:integrase